MTAPVAALRRLLEQATPGPWHWQHEWREDGAYTGSMGTLEPDVLWFGFDGAEGIYAPKRADAELIVALRNAIEPLLRRLDRAEAVVKAVEDGMKHGAIDLLLSENVIALQTTLSAYRAEGEEVGG